MLFCVSVVFGTFHADGPRPHSPDKSGDDRTEFNPSATGPQPMPKVLATKRAGPRPGHTEPKRKKLSTSLTQPDPIRGEEPGPRKRGTGTWTPEREQPREWPELRLGGTPKAPRRCRGRRVGVRKLKVTEDLEPKWFRMSDDEYK